MNPYADLDVAVDADASAIKAAYRKAAKHAHPDKGGSVDEFMRVNRAAMILLNPERRNRYDRTGDTEEPRADTIESRAMQGAFQAIQTAIITAQNQRQNPEEVEVLEQAIAALETARRNMDKAADQARANVKKAQAVAKRFKPREGKADILGPMWASHIAMLESQAVQAVVEKPVVERAILILKDHIYEASRPERPVKSLYHSQLFGLMQQSV